MPVRVSPALRHEAGACARPGMWALARGGGHTGSANGCTLRRMSLDLEHQSGEMKLKRLNGRRALRHRKGGCPGYVNGLRRDYMNETIMNDCYRNISFWPLPGFNLYITKLCEHYGLISYSVLFIYLFLFWQMSQRLNTTKCHPCDHWV